MIGYVRTLLLFYRHHLRVQPLRELMAVGGVAAGVALLFAVQVAHRSITGSFEEIEHGLAGHATLELAARGPEGFQQRVAEEVEHMPGVKAAAPIFEQPIVVTGPKGRRALTLVGSTEQIATLGGKLSLEFLRAGAASHRGVLVLTQQTAHVIGARPGNLLAVRVGARIEHLTLDATVPSNKIGPLSESPIAAAQLPIVQRLTGSSGRITRVLIEPEAGREDALRRTLTHRFGATLNARQVDTEARLLASAAEPEKQVTLLFGAISLVASITLLVASDERRRFITYLIETGTPDSMIVASLAFDALVLGLVGAGLGLLAGDVISLLVYRAVPGYIAAVFAIGDQRVIGLPSVLIALGGGVLAAFAAATLPAAVAIRAGAAAEPEAVGRTLLLAHKLRFSAPVVFACGALLICVSIAASLLKPQTTVVMLAGLAAGIVVCLPMILGQLLRLGRAVSQRSGDPAARLAIAELQGSPTRSVALLATGAVMAFLTVLIGGSISDVQHAARQGASDLLSSASVWVKPGGPENVYTTQPFPYAETEHRLQRLQVVSSVLPWRDSFLDLPGRRVWILGVPPQISAQIAPSQIVEGSLRAADRHLREGGWAAISQPIAREDHLHIGERFTLPTPTGSSSLRLAATIANYGWLPGAIVMNSRDHANLWGSASSASDLAVTFKPGISIEQGKQAVEAALPPSSALAVETDSERRLEVSQVLGGTLSRLNDTTMIVLIATITSVIALMISAILQQQGRLESLISIGISFGQFTRIIFYEIGSVLLVGCVIGMAFGLVGQDLIDGWLHHATGASVQYAPAWELGLRTFVIIAGISFVASTIAGIQAVQFGPWAAFSSEPPSSN